MNKEKTLFQNILYDHYCDKYNCDDNIINLGIQRVFELFQTKNYQDFLVNITSYENNIVLSVIAQDCAFIVDSILNLLSKEGIERSFMSIPILQTERDTNGKLISFTSDNDKNFAKNSESVSLFILKTAQDTDLKLLQTKLEDVMKCVFAVNDSWGKSKILIAKALETTVGDEKSFIEWLVNNNFIFLGSCEFTQSNNISFESGLLQTDSYQISDFIDSNLDFTETLVFKRTTAMSNVHRNANMDVIHIKVNDKYFVFIGFFTSAVYYQNVMGIPIVNSKIQKAITRHKNSNEHGYMIKELIAELQKYPRAELFQMNEDEIYELTECVASVILIPRVKIFIRHDNNSGFKSVLIFIPKNKFSMNLHSQIEEIVYARMFAKPFKKYINISEGQRMTIQLIVKQSESKSYDLNEIENAIESIVWTWQDLLQKNLYVKYSFKIAREKFYNFAEAFNNEYIAMNSAEQAATDIENIESMQNARLCKFIIENDNKNFRIYSIEKRIYISDLIPAIENAGFSVIDTINYCLSPKNGKLIYIHNVEVRCNTVANVSNEFLVENIEALMNNILTSSTAENDVFNSLILYVGLSWKEVIICRTYAAYLKQLGVQYDKNNIVEAFIENSEIAKNLIYLYDCKFSNIQGNIKDLKNGVEKLYNHILTTLTNVQSAIHDRILRSYLTVINATKRTNFFHKDCINSNYEYVSIKIASSEIPFAPLPKPFMEIFVYSNRFEAIHLRGGKVARGGIRWSDRHLDYRTEVLGLMKAQMVKNSVIVPVGSKGGFVVKTVSPKNKEKFLQEGIECYKMFLRGLLCITDNFIGAKAVQTKNSICWDEIDPYLVVAADKGTATFSDYANAISVEHGFWLGDAFASGGSAGYDHKEIGITSRGAWISVKQHFKMLNINPNENEVTVIGIGDMSGDVFGNGLLISNKINLIAAFNHIHIFLDPNPNAALSFTERKRLFEKPRSQWSDYDVSLISKGGGIFERSAKFISLTNEVKLALGIDSTITTMTPDELIRAILKAPVDLLWNGGIGTYVKSSLEANENIGDKTNDSLRINGKDLRCKIVGEGGNLGFTQLGRIEYANNGGLINTDAIDNSGGVDCSDHEVNLKIAFSRMLVDNKMNLEQRNDLLKTMTDDIAELVLKDNKAQTQILSIESFQGVEKIWEHAWLINHLEEVGELNREVEKLPSRELLYKMVNDKIPLTRPELCVLLAYAKNSAIKMLENSNEIDELFNLEPYKQLYIQYFPKILQENNEYSEYLLNHRLKNEIMITILINDFINTIGCTSFHLMVEKQGISPVQLLKAFCIVKYGLRIDESWEMVKNINIDSQTQLQLFKLLQTIIVRDINLLINEQLNYLSYSNLFHSVNELILKNNDTISNNNIIHNLLNINSPSPEVMIFMKRMKAQYFGLDIFLTAEKYKVNTLELYNAHHALRDIFKFDFLISNITSVLFNLKYISKIAVMISLRDLENLLMSLTIFYLQTLSEKSLSENDIVHYTSFLNSIENWNEQDIVSILLLLKNRMNTIIHDFTQK